jgi:hypothetical protein
MIQGARSGQLTSLDEDLHVDGLMILSVVRVLVEDLDDRESVLSSKWRKLWL